MKRALDIHPTTGDFKPFEVEVHDPATVRGILVAGVAPSIITPASAGVAPEMLLKTVPAVVFEVNPDAPKRTRSFIWVPGNTMVDYKGKLQFCHLYVDETTGHPYALFEANPHE